MKQRLQSGSRMSNKEQILGQFRVEYRQSQYSSDAPWLCGSARYRSFTFEKYHDTSKPSGLLRIAQLSSVLSLCGTPPASRQMLTP